MEQTSKDIPAEEQGPEIGQASVVWPRFQQVGQRFYGRLLLLWIPSEFGVHIVTVSPCLPTVSRHLTRAHKVIWAFEAISVQETVTGRELDTSI